MKKLLLAVLFTVMMFGTIVTSHAYEGDWRGGIRTRIDTEYERIERGIERGTLTRHEARSLKEELDAILDKIEHLRSDGHLSRRERDEINHDLDRLHMDISREKRDDDHRRRHYPPPGY
jgi:uncharacterized coiled-coil DUF342 family protein